MPMYSVSLQSSPYPNSKFPLQLSNSNLSVTRFSFIFSDKHFHFGRHQRLLPLPRALRESQDYQQAVKRKDLAEALSAIVPISDPAAADSASSALGNPRLSGRERDWAVPGACLDADDMKPVANAYGFLRDGGHIGTILPMLMFSNGSIIHTQLMTYLNFPDPPCYSSVQVDPKKWGLSGSFRYALISFLGGASFLLFQDIDIRPNLLALLGLPFLDSILLGSTCLAQISSYWPPYKRLSPSYLVGSPICGVILDAIVAMEVGIYKGR
ncbi:hypothetical protein SDJN02_16749, partial [Cucurbita argyrosperma subsp. argyrosperma]